MREEYDLEDALDMYDIIMVGRVNEYLAVEHSKKKSKTR